MPSRSRIASLGWARSSIRAGATSIGVVLATVALAIVAPPARALVSDASISRLFANGPVYALARAADGSVYVGGDFTQICSSPTTCDPRPRIAHVSAEGKLLPALGSLSDAKHERTRAGAGGLRGRQRVRGRRVRAHRRHAHRRGYRALGRILLAAAALRSGGLGLRDRHPGPRRLCRGRLHRRRRSLLPQRRALGRSELAADGPGRERKGARPDRRREEHPRGRQLQQDDGGGFRNGSHRALGRHNVAAAGQGPDRNLRRRARDRCRGPERLRGRKLHHRDGEGTEGGEHRALRRQGLAIARHRSERTGERACADVRRPLCRW